MKNYSRVCARIDLDAIEYNMEMMRKNIDEGVKVLSVIKSDGYGHGALQVAQFLAGKDYLWGYAVAALDEGMILRKGGIEKPILVMGCIFPEQWEEMLIHEIHMTIYDSETARRVSDLAVKMDRKAYIHLKIDTGMSRLGFPAKMDSIRSIEEISRMPNLVIEGMYTHFARADETDKTDAKRQLTEFLEMKKKLSELGVKAAYYHCANSAGIIDLREANLDMVRAGIATYGLYPSDEVKKELVPLRPALELVSHVVHVKWVEEGTPVSYGGTFITTRRTRIATIPVGYGDGYPRSLSNKGYVLIRGKKAPILGRVCMDQFMVDVTHIEGAAFGDLVTLVGQNGGECVTVEELSDLAEKLRYEFICNFGKRVPREFLRHGKVVGQMDYFA